MVDTDKLKGLLVSKGFRQEDAAKQIGISTPTLNGKINNKTDFLSSEIEQLCELLEIRDAKTVVEVFFYKNVN